MKVTDSSYYISEIFQSIQGEGNHAGVNSLFVRFQFCNLSCNWCDSKFTWLEKSGKFSATTENDLRARIGNAPSKHVIFTGGEPCIYRLDKLVVPGKKIHVETNGMLLPSEPLDIVLKDGTEISRDAMDEYIFSQFNWVVSPKLKNSYQHLDTEKLAYWIDKPYVCFKFIVRDTYDLDELDALMAQYNIPQLNTYVGLEGISQHSQLQPQVVEEIIKRGYNYSPRLHILLWGTERGR